MTKTPLENRDEVLQARNSMHTLKTLSYIDGMRYNEKSQFHNMNFSKIMRIIVEQWIESNEKISQQENNG